MSRFHSYLNTAREIIQRYKGEEPLSSFLKKFFSGNKKYGSKDRKSITHLCYCYFRWGRAGMSSPIEERILSGLFLCSAKPDEILESLRPEWNEKVQLPFEQKLLIVDQSLYFGDVFPFKDELSDGVEYEKYTESFFIQPDLFLRIRPDKENVVVKKLKEASMQFTFLTNSCIALPNASRVENIIELNKEALIQDYNSQKTGAFLTDLKPSDPDIQLHVWDCCAASGGKSILTKDILGNIQLTVSDIRESVLINLNKRFAQAGIGNYKSFVADLTIASPLPGSFYDLIICDAPCTGSGTWSRTPEQLFYFDDKKIEEFADRQRKIVLSVIPSLKPGGYLLYITCSVFKKENEEIKSFMANQFGMEVKKESILKGYDKKADTMYASLLKKPL